ncbi:MAG TPA: FkbM family methyltransferase [Candidatus Binataceae bacterium]|nr:FkbM family methyltransferase [Candidatus Binataceae bacterium]
MSRVASGNGAEDPAKAAGVRGDGLDDIRRVAGPTLFLFTEWIRYIRLLGVAQGIAIARQLRMPYRILTGVTVNVPGIAAPLVIRQGISDVRVFRQVFVARDYDLQLPADRTAIKTIIDGGANAGYSTAFFATEFPNARVIAIEPEASNFAALTANTRAYPNVSRVNAAIWGNSGVVKIANPDAEKWSMQVVPAESGPAAIKAMTIDEILKESGQTRIDLLKLDVEGAEREIFSGECAWLDRVGFIAIEIHDRMKPDCSEAVYTATRRHGFERIGQRGENVILGRPAPPAQSASSNG